ncbi:hypothetical protein [Streptomyces hundungensis]|uniref:hypothetical protein n=1 Tax=Streptomyces hundungensis TaxID=1077946 RepID=UPI0031F13C3F
MIRYMSTYSARSLSRVLDDLGSTLLDLLHGDASQGVEVGGVGIHDPHDEQHYPPHAIVLGNGIHGPAHIAQLLYDLRAHEAAALVVGGPVEDDGQPAQAVADRGVALLGLTRGASWAQLAAMLRTLLSEGDISEAGEHALGGVPSGDLFALANAIGTLLDAPVTIEDRRSEILAFSGGQDAADAPRMESILARQVLKVSASAQGARRVQGAVPERGPGARVCAGYGGRSGLPRVAVAVRTGDEFLGSVRAALRTPLTGECQEAFLDAAKLVALYMLRFRAGTDARTGCGPTSSRDRARRRRRSDRGARPPGSGR